MNPCLPTLLATATLAFLAGCAQGPDFQTPAAPITGAHYTEQALAETTAGSAGLLGEAQRLGGPESAKAFKGLQAQWWTVFNSPALDDLLKQALAHNPTLEAAKANLKQAEESYTAAYGSLALPNAALALQGGRERTALAQTGLNSFDTNLFNASVNVSYNLDLFGANKRALEAQQSLVDFQRFQLEGAKLALTANVVTTAIREASLREQLQTTRTLLRLQNEQLQVLEQQHQLGGVSLNPVLSQRALVNNTQVQLPPLEKALAQARHQLAVYVGKLPSEAGLPPLDLAQLKLPVDIPVSLAADLVRQRPDIRAIEALWHQAAAQAGAVSYTHLTLPTNREV